MGMLAVFCGGGEGEDAVHTCLQLEPELSFPLVIRQKEKFPVCDDKVILSA